MRLKIDTLGGVVIFDVLFALGLLAAGVMSGQLFAPLFLATTIVVLLAAAAGFFRTKSQLIQLASLALTILGGFLFLLLVHPQSGPFFALIYPGLILAALYSELLGYFAIAAGVLVLGAGAALSASPNLLALVVQTAALFALIPFERLYRGALERVRENEAQVERVKKSLNVEAEQARALLSSIGDGVYAVDEKMNIILFNHAAEEILRQRKRDIIDLPAWSTIHLTNESGAQLCPLGDCPLRQAMEQGVPVHRENVFYKSPDGREMTLSYTASPVQGPDKKVTGAVVTFSDITQRKAVEKQRDEFISIASHEMRTPIAAIEGYLSLALKLGKNVDDKTKTYVEKARKSAINLAALLKDLITTAKIEGGRTKPAVPKKLDISEVIKQIVDEQMPLALEKKLKLEIVVSKTAIAQERVIQKPMIVLADEEQLQEILRNLVNNAIKYTPAGRVSVYATQDGNNVLVCVEDTGMGIDPKDKDKLFKKFSQIESYFVREQGGTGLGLYIVKQLIERLKGKVWVESAGAGKGSKFCFTLPLVKE